MKPQQRDLANLRALMQADHGQVAKSGRYYNPKNTSAYSARRWYAWGKKQGLGVRSFFGGGRDAGPYFVAPDPYNEERVNAWLRGWQRGIRVAVEEL